MQKEDDIDKLFTVWNSINKISKPTDTPIDLDFINQISSLFSAGDFYYYVFNFTTYKMEFVSDSTQAVLGIKPKDFTLEKIFDIFHPKDLADLHRKERASVNFKMRKLEINDITKYKTVYLMRFILDNGEHKTILHQSKAINVSKDGKVQQVIGIHTDVTHLDLPIDNKVSFIGHRAPSYIYNDLKDCYDLINTIEIDFSKREKDILKTISKGYSTKEIASTLNLSPHTINTHKRNILKKSNCKNTAQLVAKCIREGVI